MKKKRKGNFFCFLKGKVEIKAQEINETFTHPTYERRTHVRSQTKSSLRIYYDGKESWETATIVHIPTPIQDSDDEGRKGATDN